MLEKNPTTVKIVYKNYPLRSHQFAAKAAVAALAAGRQDKFWQYHDALYQDFRQINDDKFLQIAQALALDQARFEQDRKDPAIYRQIQQDTQEAMQLGIRGIPAVYINGKKSGSRSLADFQQSIDAELQKIKGSSQ